MKKFHCAICMEVVQTILDEGFSATAAAAIYDECYSLWNEFGEVSIEYCDREGNCVAHELARQAVISRKSCTWVDEPPGFLIPVLMNDVTLFSNE